MERNQDVTLHICGERPKTIRGGRDRLDAQNFIVLSIEFSVNRLAAIPAEAAVRLNQKAPRSPGATPHVEFRLGENACRANSLALANGLACRVAQTDHRGRIANRDRLHSGYGAHARRGGNSTSWSS